MTVRISIIIATFNRPAFLEATLHSVFSQTLDPAAFEILVVDDGSTDDTRERLATYHDRIRVIAKPHTGVADTCNVGLAAARGAYLMRVDSDDLVAPELLAAEQEVLDRIPHAVAVSCDRYEQSGAHARLVRVREGVLADLIGCGVMMRTKIVRAIGGYRPLFWEEYDLFLRLKAQGTFVHLPRPLYRYRRHASNRTAPNAIRARGWRQLREVWGPDALAHWRIQCEP